MTSPHDPELDSRRAALTPFGTVTVVDPYRSAGNGSLTDADLVELDARLERFDVELVTTTTNRRPPAPTTPTAVFAPEFFTPAPALGSLTLEPSSPDPNR